MNKRIFSLMILACCLGAAKCQPTPLPPSNSGGAGAGGVGGAVMVDVGPAGSGGASGGAAGDDCSRAEAKAEALGCPLKRPRSASWAEVCRNGRANGVDMQDDCVLLADNCAAVHKCTSESAP